MLAEKPGIMTVPLVVVVPLLGVTLRCLISSEFAVKRTKLPIPQSNPLSRDYNA